MPLPDHPDAQALLQDADLSGAAVRSCADRLTAFAQRYLPRRRLWAAYLRDHLVPWYTLRTPVLREAAPSSAGLTTW